MRSFMVFILALIFAITSFSCKSGNIISDKRNNPESQTRDGIPAEAVLYSDNAFYEVYLKEEEPSKNEFDIATVSLWLYNKSENKASKLLTTVKPSSATWYRADEEKSVEISIDSITAIHDITVMDSTRLLVSGVPDFRNCYSFVINIPDRKAILLPSNSVVSLSDESDVIIGQSYRYVSDPEIGGRYTYIQIFDLDGNQIGSIDFERELIKKTTLPVIGDFELKTDVKFEDYENDCDFKFPVEGDQTAWKYIYSFRDLDPRDTDALNRLCGQNEKWQKTNDGYHYRSIDQEYRHNEDLRIDLQNKKITYIHSIIHEDIDGV